MERYSVDLGETRSEVWRRLRRATVDRHAPTRFATLATVASSGGAEARICLVFWDGKARLQGRLRAITRVLTGDEVVRRWSALSAAARADYAALSPPGAPVLTGAELNPKPDPANFAVLQLAVQEIDTLYLDRETHRRALFRRFDDWRGEWLQS